MSIGLGSVSGATLKKMFRSENDVLALIERLNGGRGESIRLGIGDDAAIVAPPRPTEDLLLTTDQVVEGRHFEFDLHPPAALGRKTLARGLSDLAAMGGAPQGFLLSLCLTPRTSDRWLEQYLEGLFASRAEVGCPEIGVAGGDLARGGQFSAHITVWGAAPRGEALLRRGFRPGDRLCVSGRLGGSALGLERLRGGAPLDDPAVDRHLRPTPRIALGRYLREKGAVAALDLSDGLSTDAGRMAEASGCGLEIDQAALPLFAGATLAQALHGGEEYELLFGWRTEAPLPPELDGLPLTVIGVARQGGGVFLRTSERTAPLASGGFDHFAVED